MVNQRNVASKLSMKLIPALLLLCAVSGHAAERTFVSLDGEWDIADSKVADVIPTHFAHKTPVPGLAHSSTPAFADVDLFYSRQVIQNRVAEGKLQTALVRNAGAARQDRNWFWYHRTFEVDEKRSLLSCASTKLSLAQPFG